jgi:hypothetical protein
VQRHRPRRAGRRLVPGRDVRHRRLARAEQPLEPAQQVQVRAGERGALRVVEPGEVGHPASRIQVRLEGPAGGERHERHPFRVLQDDPGAPAAGQLGGEHVVVQVPAGAREVLGAALDDPAQLRRQVREGVDLPVRVAERHADLRAGVLEHVHLLHAGQRGQGRGAVGPRRQDQQHPFLIQRGERRVVVRGEGDDLAAAAAAAQPLRQRPGQLVGRLRRA